MGLGFSYNERKKFQIEGLIPPRVKTQKEQLENCKIILNHYENPLHKYMYLMEIEERNIRLFYNLINENPEELIPLIYTPTVGLACQNFGLVYRDNFKGLFISIHDRGRIAQLFANWPHEKVKAIIVTDGERILGLGDLGVYGMGISIGKLTLYTAIAGIDPTLTLPVALDVGTNNEALIDDPLYFGLKQKRIKGDAYYEFLDEFMEAAVNRFGKETLIHFEDFGNKNAFNLIKRYQNMYCSFNDDIQGTGGAVLAGIMASCKIRNVSLADNIYLFYGAGEAAFGIAELLVKALKKENISEIDAINKIWMIDSKGLIVHDRPEKGVEDLKLKFAKNHKPTYELEEIIRVVKPSMLIGASSNPGAFNKEALEEMAHVNERPTIFALSNPTSKSECTAKQAFTYTKGTCLFASGSPFKPVIQENNIFYPTQANNVLIFPGIGLGVISVGISTITDEDFLLASQILVDHLTEEDISLGKLYPGIIQSKECSLKIAIKLAEEAYKQGKASLIPKPENMREFIEKQRYNYVYEPQ